MSTFEERRAARANMPIRIYRLGNEPEVDWLGTTTPEERIELVWTLSARMHEIAGCQEPTYSRSTIPIRVMPRT